MDKLDMKSKNIVSSNIEKIKELFPNVITEDGEKEVINFDALKQELSEVIIDEKKEKYQLTWPGKKQAVVNANMPINKTLRPNKGKSSDFETTQNIYIEGDNLDALKLLQNSYLNKIKVIYIDPPYNTGNDFIYNDNFSSTNKTELTESGQVDEEGNRMISNASSSGKYHSNWLNMIYPRLKLARNLLTKDGVIFISIDENEYNNLKKVCDEIFGEANHATTFHIQVRYGNKMTHTSKNFSPVLEYVLVYTKDFDSFKPILPYEEYGVDAFCFDIKELADGEKININGQEITIFKSGEWDIIKHETGGLSHLKETWVTGSIYSKMSYGQVFKKYIEPRFNVDGLGTLYKMHGRGEDGLGYRYYTGPQKKGATKGKMYSGVPLEIADKIKNNEMTKKFSPIVTYFDYSPDFGNIRNEGNIDFRSGKKPVKMLNNFLEMIDGNDYTVLDFFSGSASTAHAVLHHNALYNKNLKYIMVQIPEINEMESDYIKNGFNNICDIGEERIRRCAKKIQEETNFKIDGGFRVYEVDDSNMKDVFYRPNEIQQTNLFDYMSNVKEDRTPEDLLTQVILDLGLTLDLPIEEKTLGNNKVYYVAENALVACFDDVIDINIIDTICECQPLKIVFKDSSFKTDKDKINLEERVKKISPETKISIL